MKFIECPTCAAKSGSPVLCDSCIQNSEAIDTLTKRAIISTVQPGLSLVLNEVIVERFKQDYKWGVQHHDEFKWLAILGEEIGEANKAVLENYFVNGSLDDYRTELIQVAAVAVAMVECYDRRH